MKGPRCATPSAHSFHFLWRMGPSRPGLSLGHCPDWLLSHPIIDLSEGQPKAIHDDMTASKLHSHVMPCPLSTVLSSKFCLSHLAMLLFCVVMSMPMHLLIFHAFCLGIGSIGFRVAKPSLPGLPTTVVQEVALQHRPT